MTRCVSEQEQADEGLAWRPPASLGVRVETPRLVIRSRTLEDAPALFETINASRDSLLPWMPWARTEHMELASTREYLAGCLRTAQDPLQLIGDGAQRGFDVGIFERDGGADVGGTGFNGVRPSTASAETGYWIRGDRQGRGYCTEAMRHWLSWLLSPQDAGLGLARVRIYCSSANVASQRIPEKLGLRQEVHQRADYHVPGIGITDRLGWGVLREEWDCTRHAMRA